MNILKKINRVFHGGTWCVALKEKVCNSYKLIPNLKGVWFADPFIIEKEGEKYIFCEGYEEKKDIGCIYCIREVNNTYVYTKIIENPYHMSYPYVFKYKNIYYMIPETSENKTIELYQCISFPYSWKKVKNLVTGVACVDTNIHFSKKGIYLFTQTIDSKIKELVVYTLNFKTYETEKVFSITDVNNEQRNGGAFFEQEGTLLRVCQDSSNIYGEKLWIKEITLKNGAYHEKNLRSISVDDFKIKSTLSNSVFSRVHTYNQSENYEIIDVHTDKFDFFKPYKKLRALCIEIKRKNVR